MNRNKETCEFCEHYEEPDENHETLGLCNNYESPFYDRAMRPGETCSGFTEI